MKASTSLVAAATSWRGGSVLGRKWRPEAKVAAGNDGGDGGGTSSISETFEMIFAADFVTVGGGSFIGLD